MPLTSQIGLVSDSAQVRLPELMKVSAALQKQVTRDLAPIWGISATVDAFASLDDVEVGYWPVIVVDDVPGTSGVHLDKDGQPYALVEAGPTWSLFASHECIEMLVDPFGCRVVAGIAPTPDQGRVEYLVEICDPSQAAKYGYTVNDVLVSDFCTPNFFDPVAATGVRYGFGAHLSAPRGILKGGYLTWHDPVSDNWFQQTWFAGAQPKIRKIGQLPGSDARSVREIIDSKTPETRLLSRARLSPQKRGSIQERRHASSQSAHARGSRLRQQIEELSHR